MTHYEVLGVAPDATNAAIRAAYLRAARAAHPDVHLPRGTAAGAAALRRMQDVNEAWRVLGDPARRAVYDAGRRGDRMVGTTGRGDPDEDDAASAARWAAREEWVPADAPGARRPLALVPVALLLGAIAAGSAWMVIGHPALLAIAGVALAGAAVSFLVAPLLAMTAARRDDLSRP